MVCKSSGVLTVLIRCLRVGRAVYIFSSGVLTVLIRCSGVLNVDTVPGGGASDVQV